MRMHWIAVLSLGLAGCQAPVVSQAEKPALSVQTLKSPPVYRDCLLPKWRAYRPTSGQFEVRWGDRLWLPDSDGGRGSVLEVGANEGGSLVSLYSRAVADRAFAERSLRECL